MPSPKLCTLEIRSEWTPMRHGRSTAPYLWLDLPRRRDPGLHLYRHRDRWRDPGASARCRAGNAAGDLFQLGVVEDVAATAR